MGLSELQTFAAGLMDGARSNLSRKGQLTPLVIIAPALPNKPLVFISLNEDRREFWPVMVAAIVAHQGGKRFVGTVAEAWYKVLPIDAPRRMPSTYDDRDEIIMVEAKDNTGLTIAYIQPIDRDVLGRAVFPRPAYFLGTEPEVAPYQSRVLEFA